MTTAPNGGHARRIASNMVHLVNGKVAAGLISFGYIAIAARTLGVEEYGVLNLVHGYATIVGGTLSFSGFHGMVRHGAAALERRSGREFRGLSALLATIELALAALAIVAAVALVPWVAHMLRWTEAAVRFGPIYCLAILATVRTTPHGILQLAERFDVIGYHQAIMPLTRLVGALVIAGVGGGLEAYLWVWLASSLAEGLSMWVMGFAALRKLSLEGSGRMTFAEVRALHPELLRFAAINNLDLTLRDLAPRATPLIVGWVLGPAAAGLFTLAHRASAVLYQPAQMLGQAGFPVVARLFAAGNHREGDAAIRRSVLVATGAGAAVAAVFVVFGSLILSMIGGEAYAGGATVLASIAAGRAIAGGAPTISAGLTAMGRAKESIVANLVSNVALLPLLPPMLWWASVDGVGYHVILQSVVLVAILGVRYRAAIAAEVRP